MSRPNFERMAEERIEANRRSVEQDPRWGDPDWYAWLASDEVVWIKTRRDR